MLRTMLKYRLGRALWGMLRPARRVLADVVARQARPYFAEVDRIDAALDSRRFDNTMAEMQLRERRAVLAMRVYVLRMRYWTLLQF